MAQQKINDNDVLQVMYKEANIVTAIQVRRLESSGKDV
jgi:hypothetical protein